MERLRLKLLGLLIFCSVVASAQSLHRSSRLKSVLRLCDTKRHSEKQASIKILVIRHGQTTGNVENEHFALKMGRPVDADNKELRYIPAASMIDVLLTDKGKDDCEKANLKIKQQFKDIRYVFSSPMRRTVDTATRVMKGYPNKLEWHLEPWFYEILNKNQNYPLYSLENLAQYPHFDSTVLGGDKYWFLSRFYDKSHDPHSRGEALRQLFEEDESLQAPMKYLEEFTREIDSPVQIHQRIRNTLSDLRQFVKSKAAKGIRVKDHQILLVGHRHIIKYLLGFYDEEGKETGGVHRDIGNTEVNEYTLELNL